MDFTTQASFKSLLIDFTLHKNEWKLVAVIAFNSEHKSFSFYYYMLDHRAKPSAVTLLILRHCIFKIELQM